MNRILVSVMEGMAKPGWISSVEPYVQELLKELKYDGQEISILFCDDSMIQQLNKQYRKIDSATDVLSFENGEEYQDEEGTWKSMGDIVISLETVPKNAEYFETDENTEMKRLLLHGLLHINGMDHFEEHIEKGKDPECEMLVLQEKILKKFYDYKLTV